MASVPGGYIGWVMAAARGTGLPPGVVAAQINMESGFQPGVTSPAGAEGIAQFMPSTWASLGIGGSPFNPQDALRGYIKFMGGLLHQFGGNVRNALAAYNAGPGNIGAGMGYANSILSAAGSYNLGGAKSSGAGFGKGGVTGGTVSSMIPGLNVPGLGTPPNKVFDAKAYRQAQGQVMLRNLQVSTASMFNPQKPGDLGALGTPAANPLKGMPDPNNFIHNVYQGGQNALQQLAGQGLLLTAHQNALPNGGAGSGQYVNPLGKGWTLGRTDMGVDANAAPGTPIRAIGDSRLAQIIPNWYNGQPLLLFQFLSGPLKGRYWYVAEQINPTTEQIGTIFHAGQTVATYANSGTGIEIGWGSPTSSSRTLAGQQGNTGDASHNNAPAGINFRNFLNSLGG